TPRAFLSLQENAGGVLSTVGEDREGLHYFFRPNIDRAWITFSVPGLVPFERSFELPGDADQRGTVTLRDIARMKPLNGRVLDPEGRPVARVSVALTAPQGI